jgi:hypothetical protein
MFVLEIDRFEVIIYIQFHSVVFYCILWEIQCKHKTMKLTVDYN